MTKEEIIKIIIVALIGAFSKSIFDNLLGKYIPDKKKLNSYIIKIILFTFRYILPMYFLINSFFDNKPIDKYFVFTVSLFMTVFVFNILFDLFSIYISKYNSITMRILDVIDKQNKIFVVNDDTDSKQLTR